MQAALAGAEIRRVRPADLAWPSAAKWEKLKQEVGGRLIKVQSPLADCAGAPESAGCRKVIHNLQTPFYIGDQAGATQTTGWVDAWISAPSTYAVAARNADDVVAAVNFARENALFASSRHWEVALHFNKGLAGAPLKRWRRQETPRRIPRC